MILITPRASVYTAGLDRGASAAQRESMKALRKEYGFSGGTPSNVESVLSRLKTSNLFREFRQSDVSVQHWDRMQSTGDRLHQALEFLYY